MSIVRAISRLRLAAVRGAFAIVALVALAAAQNRSASGASESTANALASSMPKATPSTARRAAPNASERLAIAVCRETLFYSWPSKDGTPETTGYPPATTGDAFHVVGPPQMSLDGSSLYETTIDVVAPWGSGAHYWVSQTCVNAG